VTKRDVPSVVGHLINTRVGEVSQDIGIVESGHGQFGEDHLGESRECTGTLVMVWAKVDIPENTVSVSLEGSESGSSGKVASLHDTTRDEHPVYQHCQRFTDETYSG
jgi:hypothetical protein